MGRQGKEFQKKTGTMKTYSITIDGSTYTVTVNGIHGGIADVQVNGESMTVEVGAAQGSGNTHHFGDIRPQGCAAHDAGVGGPSETVGSTAGRLPADGYPRNDGGQPGVITSPLPGVILSIAVREGQAVKRGERIAVLEAMKMENDILADRDGIVSKIYVAKGDSLLEGARIALIGQ